ncbi:hypothetical protein CY34DRAFT_281799 [Suillus luteus UH-Slu-Lm8-n1]|uniref:Uncharacterized protein n=1 Tax=Suillus luteus UH-Slu-Lm8-n1 TaxID=930992 RepID=A0A0D0B8Y2_9AGAM|nr:hypothetical protein CY34DRAFT_281799 [Suillus luteus UH-Slu-Lm8-n1]
MSAHSSKVNNNSRRLGSTSKPLISNFKYCKNHSISLIKRIHCPHTLYQLKFILPQQLPRLRYPQVTLHALHKQFVRRRKPFRDGRRIQCIMRALVPPSS